jgi:hypothetical protein
VLDLVITLDLRSLDRASLDDSKPSYSTNWNRVYALIQSFWAYFSSLKFVIVDRFTGFDSTAVSILGSVAHPNGEGIKHSINLPMPAIFSAAGCSQLDIRAITSHPNSSYLIYLDVSGTSKKTLQNLFSHEQVPHLRILKMRDLHLATPELVRLLRELTRRLFSLDVRNNLLTDDVVPWLLALCFQDALDQRPNLRPHVDSETFYYHTASNSCNSLERYNDHAPCYSEASSAIAEQETFLSDGKLELQPDELDNVAKYFQEHDRIKSLRRHNTLLEGDPMLRATGLTHLRLANNRLTSDALQTLLMGTNQLQLLDFGSGPQTRHRLGTTNPNLRPVCQPDSVKLLCLGVSHRLQCLRVHHSIITHTPTLLTKGEFHISESHRMKLSEKDYAEEEMVYWPKYWNPDLNPRIETLTLTDVPRWSEGLVIKRIVEVLRIAANQESLIAKAMPINARRGWHMLPGLRCLRLEFVPIVRKESLTSPSISANSDADVFARESANDFSFFDQVIDSPSEEGDFSFFCGEAPSQKVPPSLLIGRDALTQIGRNVIEELRAYRQKTRMAYEAERERLGSPAVYVPLGSPHYHWTGRLELIY